MSADWCKGQCSLLEIGTRGRRMCCPLCRTRIATRFPSKHHRKSHYSRRHYYQSRQELCHMEMGSCPKCNLGTRHHGRGAHSQKEKRPVVSLNRSDPTPKQCECRPSRKINSGLECSWIVADP